MELFLGLYILYQRLGVFDVMIKQEPPQLIAKQNQSRVYNQLN
jgi:hypothetical protein